MRDPFYPVLFAIAFICVIAMGALHKPARGHDIYADWKTRTGISCCHERDCAPATAWRDENGIWHARQNGMTYIVPEHAVLPIPSPDGRSHACVVNGNVICFVPGEVRG